MFSEQCDYKFNKYVTQVGVWCGSWGNTYSITAYICLTKYDWKWARLWAYGWLFRDNSVTCLFDLFQVE